MGWEDQTLQEKVDTLREAMLHMTAAASAMNDALVETIAHTDEHHELINAHARALDMLESLLIGGNDATPTA